MCALYCFLGVEGRHVIHALDLLDMEDLAPTAAQVITVHLPRGEGLTQGNAIFLLLSFLTQLYFIRAWVMIWFC